MASGPLQHWLYKRFDIRQYFECVLEIEPLYENGCTASRDTGKCRLYRAGDVPRCEILGKQRPGPNPKRTARTKVQ